MEGDINMIPVTPKSKKAMEVLGMEYHDVVECTKRFEID